MNSVDVDIEANQGEDAVVDVFFATCAIESISSSGLMVITMSQPVITQDDFADVFLDQLEIIYIQD